MSTELIETIPNVIKVGALLAPMVAQVAYVWFNSKTKVNAKDALLAQQIKDKWIKFSLENNKESIILSIEDNAGGIPENIITKIFDPYFTTKHSGKGIGLGLNTSYKIVVEKLGGKLSAKNTENGAKFFIELPKENK